LEETIKHSSGGFMIWNTVVLLLGFFKMMASKCGNRHKKPIASTDFRKPIIQIIYLTN